MMKRVTNGIKGTAMAVWITLLTGAGFAQAEDSSRATFLFRTGDTTRKVIIELDEARAPKTVANFKKLVQSGFYEGQAVHRVIPNYLVQMGDPYTKEPGKKHVWGTGGPGYTVPAELGGEHQRGSVAMARLPDDRNPERESNGSQFYIALDDLSSLDGSYTVFGRVVRGIEHVDYLSLLTADTNDVPVKRVEIYDTGLGTNVDGSKSLAERAAKPVAAAAGGLKDVRTMVKSNLPEKLPLIPGEREAEERAEESPVVPQDDARPPASGENDDAATPEPVVAIPLDGEKSSDADEPAADEKKSRFAALAPPRLSVFGRGKDKEEPAPVESEEGTAVPLPAEADDEEGRRRLFRIGNGIGLGKRANGEDAAESSDDAGSPDDAEADSRAGQSDEGSGMRRKEKREKKEKKEKKGFFGRALERFW